MTKTFTLPKLIQETLDNSKPEFKSSFLDEESNPINLLPSKDSILKILNFSRNLEVMTSKTLGPLVCLKS